MDSVTDDFEAEKLSVQYYSEEEYQELIGGPSPEEVDKLQEQVLGPPPARPQGPGKPYAQSSVPQTELVSRTQNGTVIMPLLGW